PGPVDTPLDTQRRQGSVGLPVASGSLFEIRPEFPISKRSERTPTCGHLAGRQTTGNPTAPNRPESFRAKPRSAAGVPSQGAPRASVQHKRRGGRTRKKGTDAWGWRDGDP